MRALGRGVVGLVAGTGTVWMWCSNADALEELGAPPAVWGTLSNMLNGGAVWGALAMPHSVVGRVLMTGVLWVEGAIGAYMVAWHRSHRTITLSKEEMADIHAEISRVDAGDGVTMPEQSMLMITRGVWAAFAKGDVIDSRGRPVLTRNQVTDSVKRFHKANGNLDHSPQEAVLQILSLADVRGDDCVTFPEFYRACLLIEHAQAGDSGARREALFEVMDLNHNGKVDREELKHFVTLLMRAGGIPARDAIQLSFWGGGREATADEIVDRWMKRYDVDHDGGISREEFVRMVAEINFSTALVAETTDWGEFAANVTLGQVFARRKNY